MKQDFKKITLRLDLELVERLKKVSKETGVSQTFLVSKAIKKILEEQQNNEKK